METTEFRSWTSTTTISGSLIRRVGQGNLTALREYTLPTTVYMYRTVRTIVLLYSSYLVNFSPPLARKGGEEVNSIIHVALCLIVMAFFMCVTGGIAVSRCSKPSIFYNC